MRPRYIHPCHVNCASCLFVVSLSIIWCTHVLVYDCVAQFECLVWNLVVSATDSDSIQLASHITGYPNSWYHESLQLDRTFRDAVILFCHFCSISTTSSPHIRHRPNWRGVAARDGPTTYSTRLESRHHRILCGARVDHRAPYVLRIHHRLLSLHFC
jgi:hypothetical protein